MSFRWVNPVSMRDGKGLVSLVLILYNPFSLSSATLRCKDSFTVNQGRINTSIRKSKIVNSSEFERFVWYEWMIHLVNFHSMRNIVWLEDGRHHRYLTTRNLMISQSTATQGHTWEMIHFRVEYPRDHEPES